MLSTSQVTTTTVTGSEKKYKKVTYTNTANGSGVWSTANLTDLYGYLIKIVVTDAGTNPNAAFTLSMVEVGQTSGDHLLGSGGPVDFTAGNSSYFAIPGQGTGSVNYPTPPFLTGSYDVSTSTSNTTASAVYQVDLYLVDSL